VQTPSKDSFSATNELVSGFEWLTQTKQALTPVAPTKNGSTAFRCYNQCPLVVLFCYVITQFAASLQYRALNSHALSVKNIALFHAHSLIDFLASYDAQLRCLIAT